MGFHFLVKRENLKMIVIDIEQAKIGGKALKNPVFQPVGLGTAYGANAPQAMPSLWASCGLKTVPRPPTHYPHQPVRILNRLR
jgi:hypothetical protein